MLATELRERAGKQHQLPVLSVTKHHGIVRAEEYFKKAVHGRDTANYKVVRRGHFAYATIHLNEGSIGLLTEEPAGIVSPMYTVFRPNADVERNYLLSLLKTPEALRVYARLAEGTVNRRASIGFDAFSKLHVLLPPLPEQRKIAAILSSVDEVIKRTQALIEQLQRLKKVMTRELLWHGVPGHHTRFKMTEIGEIPQRWNLIEFGSLLRRGPDNGLYRPKEDYGDGTPIVRIDSFTNGRDLPPTGFLRVKIPDADVARYHLESQDLLINRVNSLSHLGKTGFVQRLDEPTVFESNLMRVAVDSDQILPRFAFHWLSSERAKAHFLSRAKKAVAQASINQRDVAALPTPIPSAREQITIIETLDAIEADMDAEHQVLQATQRTKFALRSVLFAGELRVAPDRSAA